MECDLYYEIKASARATRAIEGANFVRLSLGSFDQ